MLPSFNRIRQRAHAPEIKDVRKALLKELDAVMPAETNLQGSTVGITAGSRGIRSYPIILRAIADWIKDRGGRPVIIPAMGSHGEATPEGRKQVLDGLGVTAQSAGAAIFDSAAFEMLGETAENMPVYVTKAATQVDHLVVVNRIKEHTDFSGEIESGIQKMMTIGLGSFKGCSTAHAYAFKLGLEKVITAAAELIMQKLPVLLAVGIIENFQARTAAVKALHPGQIHAKEKLLLESAKRCALKLPFDRIDVLVVGELGKNISGAGMDSKVIGRVRILGQKEPETPKIGRIVVLSLTPETHGNALGLGVADITTRRVFESINLKSTAINAIAGVSPEHAAIPCVQKNEKEAIYAAVQTCGNPGIDSVRMVYIQNTLALEKIAVSEAMLDEVASNAHLEVIGRSEALQFDANGNLLNFHYAV